MGVFFLVWLITQIASSIANSISGNSQMILFVLRLAVYVLEAGLSAGLLRISLFLVDHKKISIRNLLSPKKVIINYVVASVLYGALVTVGLILLIVPGVIWAVKYQFYTYEIIDKEKNPLESIKASGKLTQGHKLNLFYLDAINFAIVLLGAAFFGIGLLVAVPISFLIIAVVYRKLAK